MGFSEESKREFIKVVTAMGDWCMKHEEATGEDVDTTLLNLQRSARTYMNIKQGGRLGEQPPQILMLTAEIYDWCVRRAEKGDVSVETLANNIAKNIKRLNEPDHEVH